jgi:hypothetical protein
VPASDAAVRVTLARHRGRAFLFWDEMGLALETMLDRKAPGHHKAVKDILIEASTKAYTVLRKKERAVEDKDSKYEDVDQPCLGIYGTAQPDVFYGALSSAHASDGFYPRLLVFETADNYPEEREVAHRPPPDELLDACRQVEREWPTNCTAAGNYDAATRVDPRVVRYDPDAKRVYDVVRKDMERRLVASTEAASGIWARAAWHVEKIALTVTDTGTITKPCVEWAAELMLQLAPAMAAAFQMRVSDSSAEKLKKRVFGVIARAGAKGVQQSVLTRDTQFLQDGRQRENLPTPGRSSAWRRDRRAPAGRAGCGASGEFLQIPSIILQPPIPLRNQCIRSG